MIKEVENEIHEQFKLPIEYLEKKQLHEITSIVCDDLELIKTKEEKSQSIYNILLKPKNDFADIMIKKWSKQYTSNIEYLNDTIKTVKNHKVFKEKIKQDLKDYKIDSKNILSIWKDLKTDKDFLERYNYIELDYLKYLNYSSSFLQCLSMIQIFSPIMSVLVPIIMIMVPFVILKMNNTPINLLMYFEILKTIAKSHFIIKSIVSLKDFSMYNIGYFLITIAFYFFQVYQNTLSLIRLYNNISKINRDLYELKEYIFSSLKNMENYLLLNKNHETHNHFCKKVEEHYIVLSNCYMEFDVLNTDAFGITNIGNMGNILQLYYSLHINKEYENSILYSFGFQGYIDNIDGLYENMNGGFINEASFDKKRNKTKIIKQYYPPLINNNPVLNNVLIDKIIITGVNASGKTTMLKTTTINIIFSQQFGMGFYSEFIINPYTHIHSYLNIPDTSGRDSLFQAESRRCKEIIDIIGENNNNSIDRHFCIFDELYSGTNPIEATTTAYAVLKYLSNYKNVHFILTTHYKDICLKIKDTTPTIINYQMIVKELDNDEIEYTYQIKKGICKIQGAIIILKEMNYPLEIIDMVRKYKKI